jgi:hypothetical protein
MKIFSMTYMRKYGKNYFLFMATTSYTLTLFQKAISKSNINYCSMYNSYNKTSSLKLEAANSINLQLFLINMVDGEVTQMQFAIIQE